MMDPRADLLWQESRASMGTRRRQSIAIKTCAFAMAVIVSFALGSGDAKSKALAPDQLLAWLDELCVQPGTTAEALVAARPYVKKGYPVNGATVYALSAADGRLEFAATPIPAMHGKTRPIPSCVIGYGLGKLRHDHAKSYLDELVDTARSLLSRGPESTATIRRNSKSNVGFTISTESADACSIIWGTFLAHSKVNYERIVPDDAEISVQIWLHYAKNSEPDMRKILCEGIK